MIDLRKISLEFYLDIYLLSRQNTILEILAGKIIFLNINIVKKKFLIIYQEIRSIKNYFYYFVSKIEDINNIYNKFINSPGFFEYRIKLLFI